MIWQQLFNGLAAGAVYALFALGFTLMFGVQKVLNLAHGAVFMAGAFIGYYCVSIGLPLWLAAILAMIGAGLVSVLVDLIALAPLRKRAGQAEFAAIVASIGADLIIISLAQQLSRTQVLRFPFGTFPVQFYHVLGLRISLLQIVIFAVVTVMLGALMFYLHRTSFGRQVRAVATNERASVLLGINPKVVFTQTFFIVGAMAGMAGVLIGLSFNSIHFLMGEPYMLLAFVVVVLGGLGSLPGALIASLLLGVLQTLTVAYLPAGLSNIIIFSLLFIVLLVRPNGLVGTAKLSVGVGRQ